MQHSPATAVKSTVFVSLLRFTSSPSVQCRVYRLADQGKRSDYMFVFFLFRKKLSVMTYFELVDFKLITLVQSSTKSAFVLFIAVSTT